MQSAERGGIDVIILLILNLAAFAIINWWLKTIYSGGCNQVASSHLVLPLAYKLNVLSSPLFFFPPRVLSLRLPVKPLIRSLFVRSFVLVQKTV